VIEPEQNDLAVGDRVTYFKGVKSPLIGRAGEITKIRTLDYRGYREADVLFDGGQSYPCWMGNLKKEGT
jgi:hypothetical protein